MKFENIARNYTLRLADAETGKKRVGVCKKCDSFIPPETCSECGCNMKRKAYIQEASCPKGKW